MEITIECPKCKWQPHANSRWTCSCGHSWNTFDTGGRCPQCKKQWNETQCLSHWEGGCSKWSPHLDWYKGLDETLLAAMREVWEEQFATA